MTGLQSVRKNILIFSIQYGNEICRLNGLVCVREHLWWLGAPDVFVSRMLILLFLANTACFMFMRMCW